MTRAWTGNTILKYAKGPTASLAPFISHATKLTAPNPTTLVIHYDKAVANVLPQLRAVLRAAAPRLGADRRQRTPRASRTTTRRAHLPIVGGGSFFVAKYDKKGTTILARNPGFYGPKPHVDAVGITWFANSDAMLAALKSNDLDYVDSVPQTVAGHARQVGRHPGRQGPGHRGARLRLQLEPEEEEEPRAARSRSCATRSRTRSTASRSSTSSSAAYAEPRATLLTPISAPYMNTDLQPEKYDLALANSMLDKLGYKRGSDGIRRTPGANSHPMSYDVITPDERRGHQPRVRDRAASRSQKIGVKLTQRAYDGDDGVRRDHEAEEPVPRLRHDDVGLGRLRRSRLHALGRRLRPVRRLERHRLLQPGLRQALPAAGRHDSTRPSASRSSGRCRRSSTATSRTSSSRSSADLRLPQGLDGHRPALPERPRQAALAGSAAAVASARVRSTEYVVRRIAFAFATIFVAVTLNFVIFRAAPGDATTALRCLSCTDEVRAAGAPGARARQVQVPAVRDLPRGPRPRRLRALVPEPPAGAAAALAAAQEHAADAPARHALLDRASASSPGWSPPGGAARWSRSYPSGSASRSSRCPRSGSRSC